MSKEDKIKELFAEKLGAHETPVNPELWNAIASQIGTTAAVTSTGLSVVAKAIIGLSAAGVIGVGAYFFTRDTGDTPKQQQTTRLAPEGETKAETEETVSTDERTEEYKTENTAVRSIQAVPELSGAEELPKHTPLKHTKEVDSEPVSGNEGKVDGVADQKPHTITPPFTSDPTPNLTGSKPATPPAGTKNTEAGKTENKNADTDKGALIIEDAQPSFEITTLPNIYVLNASGYFSIGYSGEYTDFQFTIMDDRNTVIFSSNQPDFEWRGTDMSGNQIEPGKYVYIITVKDKNGKAVNKYSPLTVINQ